MSKRIIDYPEVTSISEDDYILLANATTGKNKLLASKLTQKDNTGTSNNSENNSTNN